MQRKVDANALPQGGRTGGKEGEGYKHTHTSHTHITHTHQDAAECVGVLRSQGFQQVCSLSKVVQVCLSLV